MSETPVVNVEEGALQGKFITNDYGKSFYSFQGIPYAKPPLGSLRFKAPQPAEPWEDVRDATAEGNISAQIDITTKQYAGDENCLFLNVYTPNLDGEFLPVMIFIHGGGFKWGSGNSSMYGGDHLVDKDVVVVTINYRCGPLGFLCLNTPEVPGNAGLKDVIQAIKWVKNNIHNFGGSSGNITVFGESAGAVATTALTASPLSKELIHKVIVQSGTALGEAFFQTDPLDNSRRLAKQLGCDSENADEILDFLTSTSVRDIVEAAEAIQNPLAFFEDSAQMFALVVEQEFPGVEAFLTEPFHDILSSGRTANIPVMIGVTEVEFPIYFNNDDVSIFVPRSLNIAKDSEEHKEITEKIKTTYFKSGELDKDNLDEYYLLLSDKVLNFDTHRYVKTLAQNASKPIYYYNFNYVGKLNLASKMYNKYNNDNIKYAAHMDELGYLFKNSFQDDLELDEQDNIMRERIIKLWTNFAKTGNPTPEASEHINVTWLPVSKVNLYYMNLGQELAVKTDLNIERMTFWEDLYSKYYNKVEEPKVNNEEQPEEASFVPTCEVVNDEITPCVEETVSNVEPVEEPEQSVETVQPVDTAQPIEPVQSVETVQPVEPVQPVATEQPIETEKSLETDQPIVEEESAIDNLKSTIQPVVQEEQAPEKVEEKTPTNGVGISDNHAVNGTDKPNKPTRASNEIKMASQTNGAPKDVIRANDPPEDDLPKNIGVNKFVNFFESLGKKA